MTYHTDTERLAAELHRLADAYDTDTLAEHRRADAELDRLFDLAAEYGPPLAEHERAVRDRARLARIGAREYGARAESFRTAASLARAYAEPAPIPQPAPLAVLAALVDAFTSYADAWNVPEADDYHRGLENAYRVAARCAADALADSPAPYPA